MKEAKYWKPENDKVRCFLCPKNCLIAENKDSFCSARKNIKGKLYSFVYARPCSVHVDPIEKKPLYHFLPGSNSFSLGTFGCNLGCIWCQNWTISKKKADESGEEISPERIVELAIRNNCQSISYTYNEPTIFFEYMVDIARLAKKKGLKNVIVSNGFISKEPLSELCKYIDAANIDVKAFNEEFYKKYCLAELAPVLESLKILKKNNVWVETTTLIIPGLNDDMKEIEKMCRWLKENLGNTVIHFSRFHPDYKSMDISATPKKTLLKAREVAKKYHDFVYIGNISTKEGNNTYCPKCNKLLIERKWFSPKKNNIKEGKCFNCENEMEGIWK